MDISEHYNASFTDMETDLINMSEIQVKIEEEELLYSKIMDPYDLRKSMECVDSKENKVKVEPIKTETQEDIAQGGCSLSSNLIFEDEGILKDIVKKELENNDQIEKLHNEELSEEDKMKKLKNNLKLDSILLRDGNVKHSVETYICYKCDVIFNHKEYLLRHMKSEHGNEIYICNTCGVVFKNKSNILIHVKRDNCKIKLKCKDCKADFENEDLLSIHMKKCHTEDPHKCNSCGIKQKRNHSDKTGDFEPIFNSGLCSNKIYKCDICEAVLKSKECLLKHLMTVHVSFEHIKCNSCDALFESKEYLSAHMRKFHPDGTHEFEPIFNGELYTAEYQKRNDLNKTYKCYLCDKSFESKSSLSVHVRRFHINYTHKCKVCDQIFQNKAYLLTHVRRSHYDGTHDFEPISNGQAKYVVKNDPNKYYKCGLCDKSYKTEAYLSVHIRRYHINYTHKCDSCYKSFESKDYLSAHVRRYHY